MYPHPPPHPPPLGKTGQKGRIVGLNTYPGAKTVHGTARSEGGYQKSYCSRGLLMTLLALSLSLFPPLPSLPDSSAVEAESTRGERRE